MNVTKFATASRFLVHYLPEVCPLLFWATGTLSPLDGDDFCNWAEVAPTPFLRSTMFLLAGAGETPLIQVIRDLADIHDVVALADPSYFVRLGLLRTRKLRMLFFSRCLW